MRATSAKADKHFEFTTPFGGTMNLLEPDPLTLMYYQGLLELHGRKPDAVGWPHHGKAIDRYSAMLTPWVGHCDRVLDYGCGLGGFGDWMHGVQGRQATYRGVDVVPEFIASNKEHYAKRPKKTESGFHNITPGCFSLIGSAADITETYDHIVCIGVFNYKAGDAKLHTDHIMETMEHLFKHCSKGLHVDFLAPDPDYKEPHLHYQSIIDLVKWLPAITSRRYYIDRTYLPYEYAVHIRREIEQRDDATYAA